MCAYDSTHTRAHAEIDWDKGTGWTRAVSHLWILIVVLSASCDRGGRAKVSGRESEGPRFQSRVSKSASKMADKGDKRYAHTTPRSVGWP
jgi:hypothetical protein